MFGRSKKTPEVIGIHVGRGSLTIARIVKLAGRVEVRQLFYTALPRAFSAWPGDLAKAALTAARKEVDLKVEQVHLTLSSDLAPTYFLMVPSLKGEQLESAVKLQLESKWGSQCGELSYQFQMLEKRGTEHRVFSASIPTERLHLILGSFAEMNCSVDVIEVEGVSVANLVHRHLASNAPVAVLHISPNWGEIHVLRRDRIALSRPITRLENDGDKPWAGTAPAEGEKGKEEDAISAVLGNTYLERVARETNKTLDYFEVELLSPPIERLILVGEAAAVPGLAEALAHQLEVKVEVLDTSTMVSDTTGDYDPSRHCLAVAAAAGEGDAR